MILMLRALLMQDAADVRNLSLVYTLAGGIHVDSTELLKTFIWSVYFTVTSNIS